jgi:hypothetical protein
MNNKIRKWFYFNFEDNFVVVLLAVSDPNYPFNILATGLMEEVLISHF